MKRWLPYVGIVFGLALVAYALFFRQTEEEIVRERLHELEDAVALSGPGENQVLRAARLRKSFADLFTQEVVVAIPELSGASTGRAELIELAAAAPLQYKSARIDLANLKITLDPTKTHAVAVGDAKLIGERVDGAREQDSRTVSLSFDKIGSVWRIVNVSASPPKENAKSP
jgi:hypothetical protein